MSAKVVVRDLRKRYGAVQAANGVTFEIQEGEIFGLLGPNGAGKTTTLECIVGLRDADDGQIEVCGIDARRRPADVKQRIGAALQTTSLQDKITPREALELFGSFYRDHLPPQELLEHFALADKADAPFATLSGGQRQRLALALAFVNKPELVFLDEPTAGLDPQSRHELHDEIGRMKRDGHTLLLTTHYIEEAERLCDRIAIIDRGRVIAEGRPQALISGSRAVSTVELVTSTPVDQSSLAGLPGVEDVTANGTTARFRTADAGRTLAELVRFLDAGNVAISELHVQKATLEDVFLELTGTELRH
jgi:ABC-2 type transport system ATP-binding protein